MRFVRRDRSRRRRLGVGIWRGWQFAPLDFRVVVKRGSLLFWAVVRLLAAAHCFSCVAVVALSLVTRWRSELGFSRQGTRERLTQRQEMQPFRVLEHTADVGFEAFGQTREEVFANAARALMSIIVDLDTVAPASQVPVQAEGSGLLDLLVNWLSEVVYLFDAERWLFRDFEVRSLTGRSISAVARGEPFDPGHHQVNLLVKAITYHQLALEETGDGWRAQVYVDI